LHVNWNNQCKASANCSDIHIPHILITQNILLLFSFEIHSKTTSKPINNSSSLNKENHDRDIVWISDLNQHRFLRFYFSIFSLVLVSIEKIYQTLKHSLSCLIYYISHPSITEIKQQHLILWISGSLLWYCNKKINNFVAIPQIRKFCQWKHWQSKFAVFSMMFGKCNFWQKKRFWVISQAVGHRNLTIVNTSRYSKH